MLGVLTAIVDSRSEWRAFEARRGERKKKRKSNYPSRCGVARFEVAWAFGSNCPRSVIGVLMTAMMAGSRSERAFEVRGGE